MGSLAAANASFTLDLSKELSKTKKDQNMFFSPLSIQSALNMVLLGARKNTAAEMEKVLHSDKIEEATDTEAGNICDKQTSLPPPSLSEQLCGQEGTVHSKFQELLSTFKKSDQACTLRIANKLYATNRITFAEQFLSCVEKLYMSMLEGVDFGKSEEVRKEINTWAENETQGKIKDLFPKDSIQTNTVLVIANAVYYKGKWEKEFKKENTREAQFQLNKRESKPVQMMHQNGKFKLASIPQMHMMILELPYCKNEFSMLILLPNDIADNSTGLEQIENGLTSENLTNWMSSALREAEVDVHLPVFHLEESYDLGSFLQEMGMKDVFTDAADLSGISTEIKLKISKVFHKCYVEVNEEGTEAAAATGIGIVPLSLPIRIQFNANHPFIFLIKHNPTNVFFFYGRYCCP